MLIHTPLDYILKVYFRGFQVAISPSTTFYALFLCTLFEYTLLLLVVSLLTTKKSWIKRKTNSIAPSVPNEYVYANIVLCCDFRSSKDRFCLVVPPSILCTIVKCGMKSLLDVVFSLIDFSRSANHWGRLSRYNVIVHNDEL